MTQGLGLRYAVYQSDGRDEYLIARFALYSDARKFADARLAFERADFRVEDEGEES